MPPKQAFRALEANRTEVERDYGSKFDWQELPDRRASRIAVFLRDVDLSDRSDWPRQFRWAVDQLKEFRRVFAERVKQLNLTENQIQSSDAEDTEQ